MPGLELTDFVLLACRFQILGEAAEKTARLPRIGPYEPLESAEAAVEEDDEASDDDVANIDAENAYRRELELDGVTLRFEVQRQEEPDEFVLVLQSWLTDVSAPFELEVITGSRFTVPEDPPSLEAVATTLVFMTYPYLRETFSAITARSPYQAVLLPPLSRLPHAKVRGDSAAE